MKSNSNIMAKIENILLYNFTLLKKIVNYYFCGLRLYAYATSANKTKI